MGFVFPDGTRLEDVAGWTSEAESDLDMLSYRIISSTDNLNFVVGTEKKIIFSREAMS